MVVDGNNFISHYLKTGKPLAAGKIGVTELNILYSTRNLVFDVWEPLRHEVEDIAGLYPYNETTVKEFTEKMYNILPDIDLIPQWNRVHPEFETHILNNICKNAKKTYLQHLEPYFFEQPWTNYLENKKVLVFSPFAESIEQNYKNLDKIWNNKIKPNFKLKAIKYPFALQIDPKAKAQYKVSDVVYKEYTNILKNEDFDVGIFGTGYTSLFYTVECKRMDKVGIHLGGATQILFGVKGQRWREIKEFQPLFNDFWTNPKETEKPKDLKLTEGGCYW
jgi:hypothetical protein